MKKDLLPFILSLLLVIGSDVIGQVKSVTVESPFLIEEVTPQFKQEEPTEESILSKEMSNLVNYYQGVVNPIVRDYTMDRFLDKYYPNYEHFRMKNGDIAYLKFYYNKFLVVQKEFRRMAADQNLVYASDRFSFFKESTLSSRKEKRIFWRNFVKTREELTKRLLKFHQYLMPAISTEIAMKSQKRHFPKLFESMNQLQNLDGSPLEVFIYSNFQLTIPHYEGKPIAGLSIISRCEDIYTSGSPAVRKAYPGLRGSNKGLAVHIKLFEDGRTLSHELGHLYYLYHKWDEYLEYIQQKGKDYQPGGHGADDPSGLAAKMTENGVFPFADPNLE